MRTVFHVHNYCICVKSTGTTSFGPQTSGHHHVTHAHTEYNAGGTSGYPEQTRKIAKILLRRVNLESRIDTAILQVKYRSRIANY